MDMEKEVSADHQTKNAIAFNSVSPCYDANLVGIDKICAINKFTGAYSVD